MKRPYFESVRDVYIKAAGELYKLAAVADTETADPDQFLARGDELRNKAHETWPLSVRQDRRLYMLRARGEANTREGQAKAARLRDALGIKS